MFLKVKLKKTKRLNIGYIFLKIMSKKSIKNKRFKKYKSLEDIQKRNRYIMVIFISVIMVGSILGIFANQSNPDEKNTISYTNSKNITFKIVPTSDQYKKNIIHIENKNIGFYYLPNQLGKKLINKTNILNNFFKETQNIYFTFDPDDKNIQFIDLARFDISNELFDKNINIIGAKTLNSSSYKKLPIITCNNATQSKKVLYFKDSNTSKINFKNNCLIFEGKMFDFIKYKDLIIYNTYNIITG